PVLDQREALLPLRRRRQLRPERNPVAGIHTDANYSARHQLPGGFCELRETFGENTLRLCCVTMPLGSSSSSRSWSFSGYSGAESCGLSEWRSDRISVRALGCVC